MEGPRQSCGTSSRGLLAVPVEERHRLAERQRQPLKSAEPRGAVVALPRLDRPWCLLDLRGQLELGEPGLLAGLLDTAPDVDLCLQIRQDERIVLRTKCVRQR